MGGNAVAFLPYIQQQREFRVGTPCNQGQSQEMTKPGNFHIGCQIATINYSEVPIEIFYYFS
jgi:hypothetical protein